MERIVSNREKWLDTVTAVVFFALFFWFFLHFFELRTEPLTLVLLVTVGFLTVIVVGLLRGGRIALGTILSMLIGIGSVMFEVFTEDGYYPIRAVFLCSLAYCAYSLFGNAKGCGFGEKWLFHVMESVLAYPLVSIKKLFCGYFMDAEGKRSKAAKQLCWLLIGIAVSIVPVVIVACLLSYDERFMDILWSITWGDIPSYVISALFALLFVVLLLSALISSADKRRTAFTKERDYQALSERLKKLPALVIWVPLASLMVLYVIYFTTQWGYYMSAFTGTLPNGYTVAEYARNGFFELCAVVVINGIFLMVLSLFASQTTKATQIVNNLFKVILCVMTLLLIATALSKMLLYMRTYDLTVIRVSVTLFLVALTIVFLSCILSVFWKKVKVLSVILMLGLLFLSVRPYISLSTLVAEYNVSAYLNAQETGSERSVDYYYLLDLGDPAIPALSRLLENNCLTIHDQKIIEQSFREEIESDEFDKPETLVDLRAKRALERTIIRKGW